MLVFGKKIKLDNGKTEILFGNFTFFVIIIFISYTMNNSNLIPTLLELGISATQQGKFKEAKELFLKIIGLNDNILLPYLNLINIDEGILEQKNYKKIREISNKNHLNNSQKAICNYLLSINEKRNKRFQNEISFLEKAYLFLYKSKTKINYQSELYFKTILPKFYDKKKYKIDRVTGKKNSHFNPIFIIGLPRSGSTLIETIMSSSEDRIPTCGESNILNSTILKQLQKNNSSKQNFNISDFKFKIDFNLLSEQIIKKYEDLSVLKKNKKFYFIDKSLENFFYIDLILDIFPNAKFIHCKRNLFHTSIAVYQKFLIHLGWSYSYRNILEYFNNYLNVIEFYKKKFPKKIFDLDLEELTLQDEKKSKEVYKFCNIEWDIKSLEFYKRKDLFLKTASTKQIREKIYNYDKDRFHPYKNLTLKFSKEFPWLKKYI